MNIPEIDTVRCRSDLPARSWLPECPAKATSLFPIFIHISICIRIKTLEAFLAGFHWSSNVLRRN